MNPKDDSLPALGQAIAAAQDEGLRHWQSRHPPARAEFLMRATATLGQRRRRWRRRFQWGVPLLVIATVIMVWVAVGRDGPRPLSFEIEGQGPGAPQAWIAAPAGELVPLEFSDGSRVVLEPRSRARVLQLRANGARVALEDGAAEVNVEPRDGNWWIVDAGPYRVEVLGTAFRVGWNADDEVFSLALQHGRVRVLGPELAEPRFVSSGERLDIGASRVAPVAGADDEIRPKAALEDVGVVEPPDSPSRADLAEERRPSRFVRRGWKALAEDGAFEEALNAADAAGFDRLCKTLGADELIALADVARYAHAPSKARRVLLELRRRFSGRDEAAMAAFDLGRLSTSNCREARRWFGVYLKERPRGRMAPLARRRIEECSP